MVSIIDSRYDNIRSECLAKGKLWEDPDFSADATSIGPTPSENLPIWKRPPEICKTLGTNPEFILDEGDRFDICQGGLGDCWMLAAVATLTTCPQLFKRMMPENQTFEKIKYAGIFRFHFWKYGKWVEVLVDDRLPVSVETEQLKYSQASKLHEFWGPLLEKAYAKYYGSYQSIEGGWCNEALTDFTGCLTNCVFIEEYTPKDLSKLLLKSAKRNSLLSTAVYEPENADKKGLVTGHAYSITAVKQVELNDGTKICLVRVRNPWGEATEWTGRWSDSSNDWDNLPTKVVQEMRFVKKADGEFWIQLSDLFRNFFSIEICYIDAIDMFDSPGGPKCWSTSTLFGKWIKDHTAGGKKIHGPTFVKNPQFEVILKDCDDDDDMASFVIELTQMNCRRKNIQYLGIGFFVYRMQPGTKIPLRPDYLSDKGHIAGKTDHTEARSISKNFTMKPGNYVIIPTTKFKDEEGEFMLRVISEADHKSKEIKG